MFLSKSAAVKSPVTFTIRFISGIRFPPIINTKPEVGTPKLLTTVAKAGSSNSFLWSIACSFLYMCAKRLLMGEKHLNKNTEEHRIARAMYGFSTDSYPSLEAASQDAARRIYSSGLMFKNGQISSGGNNILADFAALAFSDDQIHALKSSNNETSRDCAEIICFRLEYIDSEETQILQKIYNKVQAMKAKGWNPGPEPHQLQNASNSSKNYGDDVDVTTMDRAQLASLGAHFDRIAKGEIKDPSKDDQHLDHKSSSTKRADHGSRKPGC